MDGANIPVPAELFAPAESSRFEGTCSLGTLEAGFDTYTFAAPLSWSVDVTNTGDSLLVMGRVEGEASTACARCLDEFPLHLEGEIAGCFLLDPATSAPEGYDEDEFSVLDADKVIRLEPLITAALLLEVPLVPLCSDDCAGLCASCGANLNEGPCACEAPAEDDVPRMSDGRPSPFAALKGLDFGEG